MNGHVELWGWDSANSVWVKVLVNNLGKLIIDPSEIFENPPTDGETGKGAQSDWCYDHDANPAAHHAKFTVVDHAAIGDGAPHHAPVAGATKQFFVSCFHGSGGALSVTFGYAAYKLNSVGDYAIMSFRIPNDFIALTSVKVIMIPLTTGTFDWSVISRFGANGESRIQHTDNATGDGQAATNQFLLELDITDAFTAVDANDIVGVTFTLDVLTTTTALDVIGLDIKYT